MHDVLIYPVGSTKACQFAASFLEQKGYRLVDHPTPEVTHLMLDAPSFSPGGALRGGGDLKAMLSMLPESITLVGGNLAHPGLEGYASIDLLQDEMYLARNGAITAHCALQVAAEKIETVFTDTPVLVIGWGRIGKCLGQLLKAAGAPVTIAARKESDRAIIHALGYPALDTRELPACASRFRLLFNTAPDLLLNKEQLDLCKNCVKIDLASKPGLEGSGVIWARGLPGVYAPESSGMLMAQTIQRKIKEVSP